MSFGDGGPDSPYMALYNASHHAIKAVSPRLSVGGPATMELLDVDTFIQSAKSWGVPVDGPDFVSTHSYPTDACNAKPDARTQLDCFTDGIIAARQQAAGYTFLLTEFNCGWKNTAIHDESRFRCLLHVPHRQQAGTSQHVCAIMVDVLVHFRRGQLTTK